jgi:hypothetical protein
MGSGQPQALLGRGAARVVSETKSPFPVSGSGITAAIVIGAEAPSAITGSIAIRNGDDQLYNVLLVLFAACATSS